LNTCQAGGVDQTSSEPITLAKEQFETGVEQYLDEASDTLKAVFDKAFRRERVRTFDNAKIIVRALAEAPQEGASRADLFNRIKKIEPKYPQPNLTLYLGKLASPDRGALIRFDGVSGRYSFSDPLYRAFALAYLKQYKTSRAFADLDFHVVFESLRSTLKSKDTNFLFLTTKSFHAARVAPSSVNSDENEQK
jgi:hypothetical protein